MSKEISWNWRRLLRNASTCLLAALLAGPAAAQFGGGRGGFSDTEVELLDQYDQDRNGVLDKTERQRAFTDLGQSGGNGNRRRVARSGNPAPPANATLTPAEVKSYPDKSLYDPGIVRTLFLTFEDANWEAQMAAFKNTDIEMPATAMVDGKSYRNVGVHFRGQTSFMFVGDGYKRPLKVSFDMLDKQQRLLGYQSLELLNAANDPSFLRTVLYLQIARDYLPAPKANFIRVVINGENWGVYVNKQTFNSDFVREATASTGARWKVHGTPNGRGGLEYWGDNPDRYRSTFSIASKDREQDWLALIQLTKVLNETPPAGLEQALKPLLDVDGVLRFLAVENALINNDGYWVRASDYSLYRDARGLFHLAPHDTNESLSGAERMGRFGGGRGAAAGGIALDPLVSASDDSKPLLSKLLAVPALRQRYLHYIRDIATRWLDWNKLGPIATQYQALIAAEVRADNRKLYSNEAFAASLAGVKAQDGFTAELNLRMFAEQRRAFLLGHLARSEPVIIP